MRSARTPRPIEIISDIRRPISAETWIDCYSRIVGRVQGEKRDDREPGGCMELTVYGPDSEWMQKLNYVLVRVSLPERYSP